MKKSFVTRLLAYSMAGLLSVTSAIGATSFVSFAEEEQEVITKTFTVQGIVCNNKLGSQDDTLGNQTNGTFEVRSDEYT